MTQGNKKLAEIREKINSTHISDYRKDSQGFRLHDKGYPSCDSCLDIAISEGMKLGSEELIGEIEKNTEGLSLKVYEKLKSEMYQWHEDCPECSSSIVHLGAKRHVIDKILDCFVKELLEKIRKGEK